MFHKSFAYNQLTEKLLIHYIGALKELAQAEIIKKIGDFISAS